MIRIRRKSFAYAMAIFALIAFFFSAYFVLDRIQLHSPWMIVEGPSVALMGEPLEIKITLRERLTSGKLYCNLHWAQKDLKPGGYLSSGQPLPPDPNEKVHRYLIEVEERTGMGYVQAVIFTTPQDGSPDVLRSVSTELIPVKLIGESGINQTLRKLGIYSSGPTRAKASSGQTGRDSPKSPGNRLKSAVLKTIHIVALLTAGILGGIISRPRPDPEYEDPLKSRLLWRIIAILFFVAAFSEIFSIQSILTEWGRRVAQERGLYYLRRSFQKVIIAGTLSVGAGAVLLSLRILKKRSSSIHLWWTSIGLITYLAFSLVNMLSFHAIDVLSSISLFGLSFFHMGKGMGASIAVLASAAELIRRRKYQPPR